MQRILDLTLASLALSASLASQCSPGTVPLPYTGMVLDAIVRSDGQPLLIGPGVGGGFKVLRRFGSVWTPIAGQSGAGIVSWDAAAMGQARNGDLLVSGHFVGTSFDATMVRWDGSSWSVVDDGSDAPAIGKPCQLVDGRLACLSVGGWCIRIFDGIRWTTPLDALGRIPVGLPKLAASGEVIFYGGFVTPGGVPIPDSNHLHSYDPTSNSYSRMDTGWFTDTVEDVEMLPNGHVIAAGRLNSWTDDVNDPGTPMRGVARWDGSSWAQVGGGLDGIVRDLHVMPNGDLLAAGYLSMPGSSAVHALAVFRDGFWIPVPTSFLDSAGIPTEVSRVAAAEDGWEVIALGAFWTVDGQACRGVVRLTTGALCEPSVVDLGRGCFGAGGLNRVTALAQPWRGGAIETRATGLAPTDVAFAVIGFSRWNAPLAALLPSSYYQCWLTSAPDIQWFVGAPSAAGSCDFRVDIPLTGGLAGAHVFHQFVSLELGPTGAILDSSASNCLEIQIGSW